MWKIHPVIQVVKEQSSKAYVLGKKVSIDESMIGTKCRLAYIQYMPNKPTKRGVKVWVLVEAKTGYIYNFDIYTAKHDVPVNGYMVFRLLNDLLESECCTVIISTLALTSLRISMSTAYVLVGRVVQTEKNSLAPLYSIVWPELNPRSFIMRDLQLENGSIREMCIFFLHYIDMKWRM